MAFLARQPASFGERGKCVQGRRGGPFERQVEFLQGIRLFAELAAKIGCRHPQRVQRFASICGVTFRANAGIVGRATPGI